MNLPLKRVLEIYVFAFAFFFGSRPLNDGDFWFHLKTGEYILNTGRIPRAEFFSFTQYGKPWVAHGWLSDAIFYAIYCKLGFNTLIFIFAALTVLAIWITYRRSKGHFLVHGFATLLGVWAIFQNIGVRPRVFTLLLSSVFLAILDAYAQKKDRWSIWWLVPLMIFWVNLHGGYLIGLALILLTLVGMLFDSWAEGHLTEEWPRVGKGMLVLLACMFAVLLNPYGLRMYTFPLEVLRSPVFQELVVDWQSPNFHESGILPFSLMILLTIAALALSPKRPRPSQVLFFLATLYASLKAQRNVLLFSLVTMPLLSEYLQSWLQSFTGFNLLRSKKSDTGKRREIVFGIILLLPLLAFAAKLRMVYGPPRQEVNEVPIKAVEFMRQKQITGNTFTNPNIWGGYLIWALPSNPVYIDGRDVYPQPFVQEFVQITSGNVDWRGPFSRYGVQNVMVTPSSYLARELGRSTEWQMVYQDDFAIVFTKLPEPSEVIGRWTRE
jgi:hypothetical protein